MDIEDLKVVWDQQNDQPLYVVDPDALHASVEKRTARIDEAVGVYEFVMIGVLLFVGGMSAGKRLVTSSVLDWLDWVTIVLTVLVAVASAGMLFRQRQRRLHQERDFESTMIGDVDRAIFQLDLQASRLKSFHYWFALPMALVLILRLAKTEFRLHDLFARETLSVLAMYVLSLAVCYVSIWFELRWQTLPSRKRLVSIRAKLASDPRGIDD
ncbi:MAG: hypothetical protein AAGD07_13905 [Planctomycetota bacterium]